MMPMVDEFRFSPAPVRGAAGSENGILRDRRGALKAGISVRRHRNDDGSRARAVRLLDESRNVALGIVRMRVDSDQPTAALAEGCCGKIYASALDPSQVRRQA